MPHVIVGVDGSASSQAALVAAVDQAERLQAEVQVVYVVSLPAMSGYEFGPIDLDAMKEAAHKTVDSAIDELDASYPAPLPVKISGRVLTGHVGIEILRAAKEGEGAALVVVGSRGYGGFKSVLLGSVTTYLAHHLACPLLIIPGIHEDEKNKG